MRPRQPKKLDSEGLWNYALRLIGGRAITIGELRKRLTARAERGTDVDSTLSRLKELRLLNDRQYADSFAASRRDQRGLGKARVMRELTQKLVPRIVAESAVSEAYKDVDEVGHAIAFLKRKIRNTDPAEYFKDPKNLQSAFRKLRYNGFSSSASVKALKQWSAEADLLEEDLSGEMDSE